MLNYLIVKKTDVLLPLVRCSHRNELVAEALTASIQKARANSLGNISNVMFWYAAYADMCVRLIAYDESKQGQKEFAEWKAEQEALKKEQSEAA